MRNLELKEMIGYWLMENNPDALTIYDLYYVHGLSVYEILEKDQNITKYHFIKYLSLEKQLPLLLIKLLDGAFDTFAEIDINEYNSFVMNLFRLSSKKKMLRIGKSHRKIMGLVEEWLNRGLLMKDFLPYIGFVFYTNTMPVYINNNLEDKNEYNELLKKFVDAKLLYSVRSVKDVNGYLIFRFHSIKTTVVPFVFNLFNYYDTMFGVDLEPLFDKFVKGIMLRIIACTFKYRTFINDEYIEKEFKRYDLRDDVKEILHEKIKNSFYENKNVVSIIQEKIDKKYHAMENYI
jgi:hypothetical protein